MSKLVDLPRDVSRLKLTHGFFDDFNLAIDAIATTATEQNGWYIVTSTDGTAATSDAVGGEIAVTSAVASAAGNEACLLSTQRETFLCAADKPIVFGCRAHITEANTNDAAAFFGLTSVDTEEFIADGGLTLIGTFDGMGFFKPAESLNISSAVSFNTTQTVTALTAANSLDNTAHAHTSATYAVYELEVLPVTSTEVDVNFFIDGVHVRTESSVDFSTDTAEEMHVVLAVKDTSAANEEIVTVDYCYCYQTR